jgi:uncharacterized protein (UPF0548 family)
VLAWILQQGHAEEAGSSLANTNTSLSSARRNVEIGRKKKTFYSAAQNLVTCCQQKNRTFSFLFHIQGYF